MTLNEFSQLEKIMIEHNGTIHVQPKDASDYLELLESKGLMYISARHVENEVVLSLSYTVEMVKYRLAKKFWRGQ